MSGMHPVPGVIICWLAMLPGQIPAGPAPGSSEAAPRIVDLPVAEIISRNPELDGLKAAEGQDALPDLLDRIGQRVKALFENFPNTSSVELVRMEALDHRGFTVASRKVQYQYLMIASQGSTSVQVVEYRTDSKGREVDPLELKGFSFLTKGSATMPLHFHPAFRGGAVFRYLGTDHEGGLHVVAFAQVPLTARIVGTFSGIYGSSQYWLQGLAWVNPETFQIVRMKTDLLSPLVSVGLTESTTRIELGEVSFDGSPQKLWLPLEVEVRSRSTGNNYRNRHSYSRFKLFSVASEEGEKKPVVPDAVPPEGMTHP